MTNWRVTIFRILLLTASASPAWSADGADASLPCNSLCRSWLGAESPQSDVKPNAFPAAAAVAPTPQPNRPIQSSKAIDKPKAVHLRPLSKVADHQDRIVPKIVRPAAVAMTEVPAANALPKRTPTASLVLARPKSKDGFSVQEAPKPEPAPTTPSVDPDPVWAGKLPMTRPSAGSRLERAAKLEDRAAPVVDAVSMPTAHAHYSALNPTLEHAHVDRMVKAPSAVEDPRSFGADAPSTEPAEPTPESAALASVKRAMRFEASGL